MADVIYDTPGGITATAVLPDGKHQRANVVVSGAGEVIYDTPGAPFATLKKADGKTQRCQVVVSLNEGGGGSGGDTPTTASQISFNPANLHVLKGTDVQTALSETDAALADLQDSVSILKTTVALADTFGATVTLMFDELQALEIDGRPNYKQPGALVFGPNGAQGIIHTIDKEAETAVVVTVVAPTADPGDDVGLRGDYCAQYAVVRAPNGLPRLGTAQNTVVIPAGLRISAPGTIADPSAPLITLASEETITLNSTTDCYLLYLPGLIQECEQLCFKLKEPTDTPIGKCRAWWNGLEWKVRDVDHGDVWTACRAHVLCKCHFTDGVLTRLSFVGWYDLEE